MSLNHNIPIKIVLLGQSAAGKTCIATRYVKGTFFSQSVSTVGASYLTKTVVSDGVTYDLNIWDTAGQELYRSLTPMYYRNAHAAVIVFDVTSRESFKSASNWINELCETGENSFIILVGNKIDLLDAREVPESDGVKLAKDLRCTYVETSALSNVGIDLLFQNIIKGVKESPKLKGKSSGAGNNETIEQKAQNESCC